MPKTILRMAILILGLTLFGCDVVTDEERRFREVMEPLREIACAASQEMGSPSCGPVVFLSCSSGDSRAIVRQGRGQTVGEAFDAAVRDLFLAVGGGDAGRQKWFRADLVSRIESLSSDGLSDRLSESKKNGLRCGISLDENFRVALLEGELNGAHLLDYKGCRLNEQTLVDYLNRNRGLAFKSSGRMILFKTVSWFVGEDGIVHRLSDDDNSFGRRSVDIDDPAFIDGQIRAATDYLVRQAKEDGSFVYGTYANRGREAKSYNIVRHAGTLWMLSEAFRRTGDPALGDVVRRAAGYLARNVVRKDADTAYVIEAKNGEIKLGGCALATIALLSCTESCKADDYSDLCRQLGTGILTFWEPQKRSWQHVLSSADFHVQEAFRTIYFDGEATFALCRLYGETGDRIWLDAARRSVDVFIERHYEQYRDQWVAYAMNAFTRVVPEEAYLEFAVRNLQDNLEKIRTNQALAPVCLEFLMQGNEVVRRLRRAGGAQERILRAFDPEAFDRTVKARLEAMENNWNFPEVAMFMSKPDDVVDTFCDRRAGFRIRIDDVQHCLGGFVSYLDWLRADRK